MLEERTLIREMLLQGSHLLNSLGAFDYQTAVKDDERRIVHRFCHMARDEAARPSA